MLAGGPAPRNADENWPVPASPLGGYARTKAQAEREVLQANGNALHTLSLRPAFVWGVGDRANLPQLVESVREGQFTWIDGGYYPVSTCHVRNVVEGLLCAAEKGSPGGTYFLTDGPAPVMRDFFTALVQAHGVNPRLNSVSRSTVLKMAWLFELPWRLLPLRSEPPTHLRFIVETLGQEFTVDDGKARRDLAYRSAYSTEDGLAEIRAAFVGAEQNGALRTPKRRNSPTNS